MLGYDKVSKKNRVTDGNDSGKNDWHFNWLSGMCSYQDEIKYCEHVCCASQDKVQPVEEGAEDTLPMGTRKLAPHNSPIPVPLNKISNLIC